MILTSTNKLLDLYTTQLKRIWAEESKKSMAALQVAVAQRMLELEQRLRCDYRRDVDTDRLFITITLPDADELIGVFKEQHEEDPTP